MAKNFGKSPITKRFDDVAQTTKVNANVVTIKLIHNSVLIDYPHNGEDISYTADIENSIAELGFTDPIEVTEYKMPDGQYMIVSGHRRRAAGVKCGMDLFPCIVKSFENENEVKNYVLLANSQRDSAKDPLLYCRRYKLHEEHLKSTNFQGSVRGEIAKRLGISVQQADRYNQMNKIINPVWDLIRDDVIGMSSVLPMAVLNQEEQQDICNIFNEFIKDSVELSRDKVKLIIEDYKNKDKLEYPHGEESIEHKNENNADEIKKSELNRIKFDHKNNKESETKESVIKSLKRTNEKLQNNNNCDSVEEAKKLLIEMTKTFDTILDKIYFIGKTYGLENETEKIIEDFSKKINQSKI